MAAEAGRAPRSSGPGWTESRPRGGRAGDPSPSLASRSQAAKARGGYAGRTRCSSLPVHVSSSAAEANEKQTAADGSTEQLQETSRRRSSGRRRATWSFHRHPRRIGASRPCPLSSFCFCFCFECRAALSPLGRPSTKPLLCASCRPCPNLPWPARNTPEQTRELLVCARSSRCRPPPFSMPADCATDRLLCSALRICLQSSSFYPRANKTPRWTP